MKRSNTYKQRLTEAAEWRLISLLFDCPDGRWFEHVESLGMEVRDKGLRKAAKKAGIQASGGLFHSIFGPGGPAPGREISYRSWVQPGYLLSELRAYYEAFSFQPRTFEVADHIAVETSFVAYLKMKELYALESGDEESALVASEASAQFIAEHLSKSAATISRLLDSSGIEYLTLAGRALLDRVGIDADKGRQIFLPVLDEDDGENFTCGTV